MKKQITSLFLLFLGIALATGQNSGKGFNFQAVARNSDGSIQSEQTVELRISIYPAFEKTAVLYSENNAAMTDNFGVFSLVVGNGVYQSGSAASFDQIDFSQVDAYMNVVLLSGNDEVEILHSPLLSVPYAESAVQADNGMPVGAILPYAGEVPDNSDSITVYGCKGTWRLCNGAEYDPLEYVSLHLVLNNAWGTNRLPDLRGTFMRGANQLADDAFSDPDALARSRRYDGGNIGNAVGSVQSFAMENVEGTIGFFNRYAAYKGSPTAPFSYRAAGSNTGIGSGQSDQYWHIDFDLSLAASTSSETRPSNAYVNYIIRVK